MKNRILVFLVLGLGLASLAYAAGKEQTTVPPNVAAIVAHSCGVSGCHRGKYPTGGMNLEPDKILTSTLNVPSQEASDRKRIDTINPEKSYLLAKIKGEAGIVGQRMPFRRDPLPEDQIKAIETWIMGLHEQDPRPSAAGGNAGGSAGAVDPSAKGQPAAAGQKASPKPAFWGTRLVNLPTAETIDKHDVLFRVSHRFYPPLSIGEDGAYGLDGPAFIILSLGYAFTDNFMVTVGRSNLNQEWDLTADYRFLEPSKTWSLPLAGTLHVGGSWVSVDKPAGEVWASRFRFSALFSLSWKVTDRISLLAVPAFATNTDFQQPNAVNTFSLGAGGRVLLVDDLSVIGEWVPVITGHKDFANGWGLGFEKKIGGHVFQLFVTNTYGLTAGQFIIGGDLGRFQTRFFDRIRLGFNIFRRF